MARGDQRLRRAHRTARPSQRRVRTWDDGIIPVLARTASEVEAAAQRGGVLPSDRTKFQVVAVLARQERSRVQAETGSDARRSGMLRRLDGIALILAQIATRDTSLLALLTEDAVLSDAARTLMRNLLRDAGREAAPVEDAPAELPVTPATTERRVVPQAIVSRRLANPFLAPDFSAARPSRVAPARRLAT